MGEPAYQLPDEDKPDIRPDLRAMEGGSETTPRKNDHLHSVGDDEERGSLFNKDGDAGEQSTAADSGAASTTSGLSDQVGKGFTNAMAAATPLGGAAKLKNMLWGSKRRKQTTVGAGVAGAGVAAGVVALIFMLLPLKIESMVSNLESRFGAATTEAVGDTTDRLFKGYLTAYVLHNLGTGRCHSTIDAGCVSVVKGNGPIVTLYKAWKNKRVEQKLAQRGLSFGRSGNTWYINTGGTKIDFSSEDKMANFLSNPDTTSGDRNVVERALRDHLKTLSLWDRLYYRFRLAPFVNKKYGTRHCINACRAINKFTDDIATKKKAAKAYIIRRVISPLSASYGIIMQCVMESSGSCKTTPDRAETGDTTQESPINKELQKQLDDFAAKFGSDTLKGLAKTADDISKEGFTKVLVKTLAQKIGSLMGKDISGEATAKAVPVVGWVLLIARVINSVQTIGPTIRYLSYAANAAAAAQLFTMYQTVASESKSGQIDATQLGSFNTALDTNLSGAASDQASATQTPLYQSLMSNTNTGSQTSFLGSLAGGSAFADSTSNTKAYTCDDGNPVPSGQIVCDEEKLDRGNSFATKLSDSMHSITSKIPGFNTLLKVVNTVGNAVGSVFGKVFSGACSAADDAIPFASPCHDALNAISAQAAKFMNWLIQKLVSSPISDNMSGGRIFDMMAAGADTVYNSSCQENLGCAHVDDATAINIQNSYLQQQKDTFSHQSLFARMFSTDTPYSLVSQVALAMPGSLSGAGNQLASSLTSNPFGVFSRFFSGIFSPSHASAALSQDPFGVPQAAYTPDQIPKNPSKFWNDNCINGPEGWDSPDDTNGSELDVSQWINNPDNASQDPNTGMVLFKKPNRCMLIVASLQSSGGAFDSSLIPDQNTSSDTADTGGSFVAATYNLLNADGHTPDSKAHGGCNTNPVPGDPTCGKTRAALAAKIILGQDSNPQIDLIGTQETSPTQYRALLDNLPGYQGVPSSNADINKMSQQKDGAVSVVWNTAKFTKCGEGKTPAISNVANASSNPGGHITSPWVCLQTSSGQKLYVTSIHYPNGHFVDPKLGDAGTMKEAARVTMDWVRQMKQQDPTGIEMVMGDFNDDPWQKLSYCIYTQPGLMTNTYDMANDKNTSKACPSSDKHYPGFLIDHVYVSQDSGLSASGWTHMGEDKITKHASDHTPVYVTLSLPGADATTTTTAATGKAFVGNDGFGGGSCVDYVEYILKRHSSKYHGGTLGNGKDVANSLGKYGYTVNHTPAVHAVVSFGTAYADPTYGHTAIVAQVNKDGSIVVEEANWANPNAYGTHTVKASEVSKLTYAHTEVGWH